MTVITRQLDVLDFNAKDVKTLKAHTINMAEKGSLSRLFYKASPEICNAEWLKVVTTLSWMIWSWVEIIAEVYEMLQR